MLVVRTYFLSAAVIIGTAIAHSENSLVLYFGTMLAGGYVLYRLHSEETALRAKAEKK